VPLSLAVARSVPLEFRDKQARDVLCAWIIFVTDKERASNSITSPPALLLEEDEEEEMGAPEGTEVENGLEGEGRGEG